MKKIGMALSGGGARGIAHLGVLMALAEFGIRPDVIAGSSAGGIVGGFYAAGYGPAEILDIIKHAELFNIFGLKFHQGIFSMKAFEKIYLKHIPHNSFEGLNIPLHITATDIVKCETRYFSMGSDAPPLSVALMATSCVPVAFQPVEYDGAELLDGGILNNFPIEPLEGACDTIIGVHVNSLDCNVGHVPTKDLIDRTFHLSLRGYIREKQDRCALFIEPSAMSRFGMFDIQDSDAIYIAGYEHTMSMAKEIEEFQKGL